MHNDFLIRIGPRHFLVEQFKNKFPDDSDGYLPLFSLEFNQPPN